MGVGVDKAGEEQAACDIVNRVGVVEIPSDLHDLFILQQYIGPAGAAAGDNGSAFEQCPHDEYLRSRRPKKGRCFV